MEDNKINPNPKVHKGDQEVFITIGNPNSLWNNHTLLFISAKNI